MRRFLGSLLDKTLVNLVYHVESKVKLKKGTPDKPNVYDELNDRPAIKLTADLCRGFPVVRTAFLQSKPDVGLRGVADHS